MQNHMGYLIKRVFINKQINDDHFLDVCVTHRGERLIWYCKKSEHRGLYGFCMDEITQKVFFDKIGTDYNADDFDIKVQRFFANFQPDDYFEAFHSLQGDSGLIGNTPHHIRFDRESDPHVLMTDGSVIYHSLSEDICENFLFELIMNSVQEFQNGEAREINVRVQNDKYEIIDDGAGIAVEDREDLKDLEWKRILVYPHLVFDYPNRSSQENDSHDAYDFGVYYNNTDYCKKTPQYYYKGSMPKNKSVHNASIAHAQCYAKTMSVTTTRGSKNYSFQFKNGYCVSGRICKDAGDDERGTHITWVPDNCCFHKTIVQFESLSLFLERQAFLNPGLKIALDYNGSKHNYYFPNGIKDYLAARVGNLQLPIKKMEFSFVTQYDELRKNEEELDFVLGVGSNGFAEAFHNYREVKYGVTLDPIFEMITDWLNKYIRNHLRSTNPKYEKVQITIDDVKKHFCVVVASFAEYTDYVNEAQKGLDDPFFDVAVKKSIKSILSDYFGGWWGNEKQQEEAWKIIDLIIGA